MSRQVLESFVSQESLIASRAVQSLFTLTLTLGVVKAAAMERTPLPAQKVLARLSLSHVETAPNESFTLFPQPLRLLRVLGLCARVCWS